MALYVEELGVKGAMVEWYAGLSVALSALASALVSPVWGRLADRKFNVTIHYNSQKFAGEYYNVKFSPDEKLEDVLKILQQLVGIHYKIKGNVVFIN